MNNKCASTMCKNGDKDWAVVLADGRLALREAQLRVRQLKKALASIEIRIRNKEQLPGRGPVSSADQPQSI
jgi:hypothetical protein